MKLSNINEVTAQMIREYQKNETVKNEPDRQANGNVAPEERVDLSTTAREVQRARIEVEKVPDVREEKVQELREQVEQETYSVSGDEIAESIASESLVDVIA